MIAELSVLDPTFLAILGVALTAYTVQTIAGFGGMILSLTLAANIAPIAALLPLFVPVSLAQTGFFAVTDRDAIDRKLLLRSILPVMGLGAVVGRLIAMYVSDAGAKRAFGVLVVILAVRELYKAVRSKVGDALVPLSRGKQVVALAGAGVTHGMYASGGPLLVYAVGKSGLDKRAFRATLSAVFFALNVVITATFVATGEIVPALAPKIALMLVPLGVALVVGQWAHARIEARRFQILVFGLLTFAGLALIR